MVDYISELAGLSEEILKRDKVINMLELRIRRTEQILLDSERFKRIEFLKERIFRISAAYFLTIILEFFPEYREKAKKFMYVYGTLSGADKLIISARRIYYLLKKDGKLKEVLKDVSFPIILDDYALGQAYKRGDIATNIFQTFKLANPPTSGFRSVEDLVAQNPILFELKSEKIKKVNNTNQDYKKSKPKGDIVLEIPTKKAKRGLYD